MSRCSIYITVCRKESVEIITWCINIGNCKATEYSIALVIALCRTVCITATSWSRRPCETESAAAPTCPSTRRRRRRPTTTTTTTTTIVVRAAPSTCRRHQPTSEISTSSAPPHCCDQWRVYVQSEERGRIHQSVLMPNSQRPTRRPPRQLFAACRQCELGIKFKYRTHVSALDNIPFEYHFVDFLVSYKALTLSTSHRPL